MKAFFTRLAAITLMLSGAFSLCAQDLLITKIYNSHNSTTNSTYHQKFVEIHNPTGSDIDLSNYVIMTSTRASANESTAGYFGSGTGTAKQYFPEGAVIEAGGYYLIGVKVNTGLGNIPIPVLLDAKSNPSLQIASNGGAVLITTSDEAIPIDSLDQTYIQDRIVNMMTFGNFRKTGLVTGTGELFPHQAPILSSVITTAGDYTHALVRKFDGSVYANTGNDSLDFEKVLVADVDIYNASGIQYRLYSQDFQACADSNLADGYLFPINDIANYAEGWQSEGVSWNGVDRGVYTHSLKFESTGYLASKSITFDGVDRVLCFEVAVLDPNVKEVVLNVANSKNGSTKTYNLYYPNDSTWFPLFYAVPDEMKNEAVTFTFSLGNNDALAFRNFDVVALDGLPTDSIVPESSVLVSIEDLRTKVGDDYPYMDQSVSVVGVVQNYTWGTWATATGNMPLRHVIYDGTSYIAISGSMITPSNDRKAYGPQNGDSISITGKFNLASTGVPQIAFNDNVSLCDWKIIGTGGELMPFTPITSISDIEEEDLSFPLTYIDVTCVDNSKQLCKFVKVGTTDTVYADFPTATFTAAARPAVSQKWDLQGFGYISSSTFCIQVPGPEWVTENTSSNIVKPVAKNLKVSIFPNPSSDGRFNIDFNQTDASEIRVYNMSGKIVLNTKVDSDSYTLDLNKETKGLYFVTVLDKNGVVIGTQKIVSK